MSGHFVVGVALNESAQRGAACASPADRWTRLGALCNAAGVDYATLGDTFQLDGPIGAQDGVVRRTVRDVRPDSTLTACFLAQAAGRIHVLPTAITTHMEPFHVARSSATLDRVADGRCGLLFRVSAGPRERANNRDYGHADTAAERYAEAEAFVRVVRRLWDSWQDDAEIRDHSTLRFIDRNRLHRVEFVSRWFSVKGPLTTPRPAQGHLPVGVVVDGAPALEFAAAVADVAFCPDLSTANELSRRRRSVGIDAPLRRVLDLDGSNPAQARKLLVEAAADGFDGARLLLSDPERDLAELSADGPLAAPRPAGTCRDLWALPVAPNMFVTGAVG